MGYAQMKLPAARVLDEDIFVMKPISIRIREVKVPPQLLKNYWKISGKTFQKIIVPIQNNDSILPGNTETG